MADITATELDEALLFVRACHTLCFGELLFIALDSDHAPTWDSASHGASELAQPGAEIDNGLVAPQRHLTQRRVIEQDVIQQREAALLVRCRPVDVNGFAHGPSTGYPASIHASNPPASGRTGSNPFSISMRATRAADASFGHVQ